MKIIIDDREPDFLKEWLPKQFKDITFDIKRLPEGDFISDKVIVERKTVADLYGSVVGTDGKKGRLPDQVSRMCTHQNERVVVLLVTGDMDDFITLMSRMHITVDLDVLEGIIASVIVRDNIRVLIDHNEKTALKRMVRIMRKIDEGELDVPSVRNMDMLAARLLNISKTQWYGIKALYGTSFTYLSTLTDKDFMQVKGIGKVRAKNIRDILKNGW